MVRIDAKPKSLSSLLIITLSQCNQSTFFKQTRPMIKTDYHFNIGVFLISSDKFEHHPFANRVRCEVQVKIDNENKNFDSRLEMKMSLDVNIEEEEFNKSDLHNCIQELAKLKGIKEFEYHVEFACERSDSFVANIYRVFIKDTENDMNFSVIVKTLVNATRQELFQELHKREVFVYKEVFPIFRAVQDDIYENQRVVIPEFLYYETEKDKEILVLEDLTQKGFAIDRKLARFENLDYLQVRLVMSELAKFHGLSFVLQCKDPEKFHNLSSELNDLMFDDTFLNKSKLKNYFSDSFTSSLKVITDDEAKKKLGEVEPKLLEILRKHVQPRKHNVLCHGDCWINNVLFKHEVMKDSQICFLDFQAMRYGNPATDIIYFLYLCTDSTFRQEHFGTLLSVYYESLKLYLRQYNINVKQVYPIEDFDDDIKFAQTFGLVMALVNLRIVTTALEHNEPYSSQFNLASHKNTISASNDDKGEGITSNVNDDELSQSGTLFSLRINDVVKENMENGVLDKLFSELKD